MNKRDLVFIDTTLIELAAIYLIKKSEKDGKEYTVADLFFTCEKILEKVDLINKNFSRKKIIFLKDGLKIDRNWIKKLEDGEVLSYNKDNKGKQK